MDLSLSICYNSAKQGGFTPPKRRAKEGKATEKEKLAKTIRPIGWGFVLIFLNFNIGTLNLVPSWLGYLLFVSSLSDLKKEPSAPRLKDFAWLLVGLDFFYWILESFGLMEAAAFFYVIPAAVSIYFDFKFFTFLAEIAGRNCCPEEEKTPRSAERQRGDGGGGACNHPAFGFGARKGALYGLRVGGADTRALYAVCAFQLREIS